MTLTKISKSFAGKMKLIIVAFKWFWFIFFNFKGIFEKGNLCFKTSSPVRVVLTNKAFNSTVVSEQNERFDLNLD